MAGPALATIRTLGLPPLLDFLFSSNHTERKILGVCAFGGIELHPTMHINAESCPQRHCEPWTLIKPNMRTGEAFEIHGWARVVANSLFEETSVCLFLLSAST
jgi:hypothetical protein